MKKIKLLSAIITALIAFSSLSIPALSADAASNGYEMGDVNGDGNISIDDVTDIQKYLANIIDFTDEQVALSDVDKNGSVSIDDVTYIQKQIAGISESENPTEPTEPVFPEIVQGGNIILGAKDNGNSDTYSKTFENIKTITVPGHTFSVYKWDEWECTRSDYVGGYISSRVIKNSNGSFTLYLWSRVYTGSNTIKVVGNNDVVTTYTYTVKNAPSSISLNKTSITLGVGETYDLDSSLPKDKAARNIVYTSSDSSVASVKASGGIVTAQKVGKVTITATTYNGKKVNCSITVKNAPTSINLNKTNLSLSIGETYDLDSSLPKDEAAHSIVYTSSDSSVASVKASGGIVTAKSPGEAIITATAYNGISVKCVVKVNWHDAVYEYIEHPAETEQVWVVDKESYTFEEGIYERHVICKGCVDKASEIVGYRLWDIEETAPEWYAAFLKAGINPFLDYMPEDELINHMSNHLDKYENSGSYTATVRVSTQTITVPEEGHWETKVIKEAWTEKVLVKEAGFYDDDGKTWHDAVYEYIEHPAETEQVWVVDKESYTFEEGIYEYHDICKGCVDKASEIVGYRLWDIEETEPEWYAAFLKAGINPFLDEMTNDDMISHSKAHIFAEENSGYYFSNVRVGTQTITVPEQGHWETKVIKEAWTEKVLVRDEGYY